MLCYSRMEVFMKPGKAFEILVKQILLAIGFSEVHSDGLYIFDGAPGQMIQGLGEAHNADVLLEPPVQTPFYSSTRLLVECKDYQRRIGLNTVRSILGLREDINHFEILDINELTARRANRRSAITYNYIRYSYQVAIASLSGFTGPAQKFAATHRIPLIEFNKLPFWEAFLEVMQRSRPEFSIARCYDNLRSEYSDVEIEEDIIQLANSIGENMAVAITNSGQMLFLYRTSGNRTDFQNEYSIYWQNSKGPWELRTGDSRFVFQLPTDIAKIWLSNSSNEIEMRKEAINCKQNYLSSMVVYYREYGRPMIKMISINQSALREAKQRLRD